MSRATIEAWYTSERIDRLKLVAAYLFLNGLVHFFSGLAVVGALVSRRGGSAGQLFVFLAATLGTSAIWFCSAWLLWHARKAGAYWVIFLSVLSVLGWITQPAELIRLIIELIPVTLVAMSWSALKTDGHTTIAPKR